MSLIFPLHSNDSAFFVLHKLVVGKCILSLAASTKKPVSAIENAEETGICKRFWKLASLSLQQALNCIMEMVEKTRRSMAVLRRCQEADREELTYWKRRCSETTETRKGGSEFISRQHSPGSSDSVSSGKRRSQLLPRCCRVAHWSLEAVFPQQRRPHLGEIQTYQMCPI